MCCLAEIQFKDLQSKTFHCHKLKTFYGEFQVLHPSVWLVIYFRKKTVAS